MTKIDHYLTELEQLLVDIEPTTREGLVEGIREELLALPPEEVAARLHALGDPAFVAASVRAERGSRSPAKQDAAWYSILTVILLTAGGFVVPVIGGLAGLALLWASRTWNTMNKVLGTIICLGGSGLAAATLLPVGSLATAGEDATTPAPILPVILFSILLVAWLGAAIWLLIVADRRRRHGATP